jgi:hypothetical protein
MANDGETVTRALQAVLTGPEHEASLVAVEAEFADGFELPRPGVVHTSEKAVFGAYPAYEIVLVGSRRVSEDTPLARTHEMDLYVTQVGDDEERLTSEIKRLVLAMRRLFEREERTGARLLMPFVGNVPAMPMDEDYTPVARPRDGTGASHTFVKTGVIRLVVGTIG